MSNLEYFYKNTIYYIEQPSFTLRIEKVNQAWEKFCRRHNIQSYALITPYNPRSEKFSQKENEEQYEQFKALLEKKNHEFYPYRSIDPRGEWPDEHGCAILNLLNEDAIAYANKYDQNAFAKAKVGEPLELQWLI